MDDTIVSTFGWAFQKESELRELFNYHLYKLKETGIQYKLNKNRTYQESDSSRA
jgi:ABC-type amino acid transport substrate-binding protein